MSIGLAPFMLIVLYDSDSGTRMTAIEKDPLFILERNGRFTTD